MSVISLGYIELEVQDLGSWADYGTNVLGLMISGQSEEFCNFRMDSEVWRISVVRKDQNRLSAIGLEVGGPTELTAMKDALSKAGYAVRDGGAEYRQKRGVTDIFICNDPDGLQVEIYYGRLQVSQVPFASPAGVTGFVAEEQGLGHIGLAVSNVDKSREFYMSLLGFKMSDQIVFVHPGVGELEGDFYHCNPRHHTVGIFPADVPDRLLHFMLQAKSINDVGFALDRANEAGVRVTHGLGRHTNDKMFSFYMKSPSGAEIEFGYGGIEVGPDWRVARHNSASMWGHKPVLT